MKTGDPNKVQIISNILHFIVAERRAHTFNIGTHKHIDDEEIKVKKK